MFGRSFLLLLVLGAAIGVPYVATEWSRLKARFTGEDVKPPPAGGAKSAQSPANLPPGDPRLPGMAPPSDETPLVEMAQAFRFDVTPAGVLARWPRVSTGLADEQLHGMRVALITGTRVDDVTGALTYYFAPSQRCAEITFTGTTGDQRRLTALLVERFNFKRFVSAEPGVQQYDIRWNGKPHSEVTIRPASVVRSSAPHTRYEVKVVIVDPAVR